MPPSGLKEKDIKKIQKDIKDIRKYISAIEKIGGKVPKILKTSLKHLDTAINTGEDIGKAADAASKAVKDLTKDLKSACKVLRGKSDMVCESKIDRKWLANGTEFTLNVKEKNSVPMKFIEKTVKRYTPDQICKHWDYCAKIDK